jgi:hypothetical protein
MSLAMFMCNSKISIEPNELLGMNAPPDIVAPFYNRLVQSIRSQDSSQLENLFRFHFPSPPSPEIQAFISTLRLVHFLVPKKLRIRNQYDIFQNLQKRLVKGLRILKTFKGVISTLNGVH